MDKNVLSFFPIFKLCTSSSLFTESQDNVIECSIITAQEFDLLIQVIRLSLKNTTELDRKKLGEQFSALSNEQFCVIKNVAKRLCLKCFGLSIISDQELYTLANIAFQEESEQKDAYIQELVYRKNKKIANYLFNICPMLDPEVKKAIQSEMNHKNYIPAMQPWMRPCEE